ncbi:MAG TPA: DUF4129 domain-containing protein [Gemmatimonadales bacterium]|nr:DUF4129 domain-containing protein [Gemmatimonadales bacterium]
MTAPLALSGGAAPADSLRQALREVFARPEYQWTARHRPLQWLWDSWRKVMSAFAALGTNHPVLARFVFWSAVVALLAILAHFGYVAWQIYRATVRPEGVAAPAPALRLEDAGAYRERADALAGLGRYTEALAYRFLALLLDLERARALSFHPAKTPAEYVGEARLDLAARASFATLVERLYRHVFGAEPCDDRAYRAFGAAAEQVVQHVAAA